MQHPDYNNCLHNHHGLSFVKEYDVESEMLYIMCCSLQDDNRVMTGPMDFYSISRNENMPKSSIIFIRDIYQSWYYKGLSGFTKNIDETVELLQSEIDILKPKTIRFVGASMGGWAAIMFALLLGIGDVIAFGPQTFIHPELRRKYNDTRWKGIMRRLIKLNNNSQKILDLSKLLINLSDDQTIHIYSPLHCNVDYNHTDYFNRHNRPNIINYYYDFDGHGMCLYLKNYSTEVFHNIVFGKITGDDIDITIHLKKDTENEL